MKKILIGVVICAMSFVGMSDTITNIYNFSASLRVPYLKNGVRTYTGQALKGYLCVEYTEDEATAVWLELQNNKTKAIHVIEASSESFYYLMGKTNKTSLRVQPTVFIEGADVDITSGTHELIKKIQFAGTGSLKTVKSVTSGCSACGEPTKTVQYCNVLYKMNGYATGVMDCQCPDDEDWWHTVKTCFCGVFLNDLGEVSRVHEASFWGTWSATYNTKLSDAKLK